MTIIDTTEPQRATHPVHIGHLVMGLAFLGIVAIWGVVQSDLVSTEDVRWLLPLPWVFAGGAGLIAVLLAGRRRSTVVRRPDEGSDLSAPDLELTEDSVGDDEVGTRD